MRAVVQRVKHSSVLVGEEIVGEIKYGSLVLLGVSQEDDEKDAAYLAEKICHLRIFEDDEGRMNRSLIDENAEMLVVSQFTLLGDCRKGRRPSYAKAAAPEKADDLYQFFVEEVKKQGINVATGQFRAMMQVHLINDGPVTLIVESK